MSRWNRWSWSLGLMLVLGALTVGVACGGGDDDDDSGSNGDGATATADTGDDGEDATATEDTGGDDNGSSADEGDLESFVDDLEPPDAKEAMRFTADDGVTVAWETDQSSDDLKDYYEDKFDDLDLDVEGTFSSGDGTTWVVATTDGGIGGTVTIAAGSERTSLVQVIAAPTN